MNRVDYSHPIRRSPRATHELQRIFEQLQLENNKQDLNLDDGEEDDDSDDDSLEDEEIHPLRPRRRLDLYEEQPATSPGPSKLPPRSPAHVNPLRSHPLVANGDPTDAKPVSTAPPTTSPVIAQDPRPVLRYRFSHPFREQLYAPRQPDPAPRRRPANLVSYKPAHQRLHPRLRKRTSLDTIASVTTTASVPDSEDAEADDDETSYVGTPNVEMPAQSMSTLESEYPTTPNTDLGSAPNVEPPTPGSQPDSLRTASVDSIQTMPPTTPVSSAESHPHRGILRKLKPGKRKESIGAEGAGKMIIERRVSVDQTSYRSNSSSASNTVSSGTPSRYPNSEAGNSRSSSTWTASSHDTSSLTPEELKKCKKKGINPALFAEMKAARKGKWTSPIGGNTFLA